MFSVKQMISLAKRQLARDLGCDAALFSTPGLHVVQGAAGEGVRAYPLENEPVLRIAAFSNAAVVSSDDAAVCEACRKAFAHTKAEWVFDAPALRLAQKVLPPGYETGALRLFYLPTEAPRSATLPKGFRYRWFEEQELHMFKGDKRFGNALMFMDSAPDKLAIAAYDGGTPVGMAGASADCEDMWQMGIDVADEYRGHGLAAALVAALRQEILHRGKLPFYGTAPSHIASQFVAHSAGFTPVWAQLITRRVKTTEE